MDVVACALFSLRSFLSPFCLARFALLAFSILYHSHVNSWRVLWPPPWACDRYAQSFDSLLCPSFQFFASHFHEEFSIGERKEAAKGSQRASRRPPRLSRARASSAASLSSTKKYADSTKPSQGTRRSRPPSTKRGRCSAARPSPTIRFAQIFELSLFLFISSDSALCPSSLPSPYHCFLLVSFLLFECHFATFFHFLDFRSVLPPLELARFSSSRLFFLLMLFHFATWSHSVDFLSVLCLVLNCPFLRSFFMLSSNPRCPRLLRWQVERANSQELERVPRSQS